jgi:hypothetical protein
MLVHDPAGWRRERMPTLPDLEILALHEDHWRLEHAYKAADEVCVPPLEAISFSLASFWP